MDVARFPEFGGVTTSSPFFCLLPSRSLSSTRGWKICVATEVRNRSLLELGKLTVGRVTWQKTVGGKSKTSRITYVFKDDSGFERHGEGTDRSRKYREGMPLLVFFISNAYKKTGEGPKSRETSVNLGRPRVLYDLEAEKSEWRITESGLSWHSAYRLASGRTNFNAVCVGEKPTTFTSFSPAFRPAAITSFSVMVFWPLG